MGKVKALAMEEQEKEFHRRVEKLMQEDGIGEAAAEIRVADEMEEEGYERLGPY